MRRVCTGYTGALGVHSGIEVTRGRGAVLWPWREAYRRWRAAAVGAATARGPGVRDVEIRTVGAFGVIGGRDCCKRAPSHFYSVVRGIHPAAALFLTYQNFVGKLSNKVQIRPPEPALPIDLNPAPHQRETDIL